jgi:hypothetical protein
MELSNVKEVEVKRVADEANALLRSGWKLLNVSAGIRRVHHEPVGDKDQPYDFDVPFCLFVLGRVEHDGP